MLENIKSDSPFITGTIEGTFTNYCSQVKAGAKPIAFMGMKTKYVDLASNYAKQKHNLHTYIQDVDNYHEWKTIFIYKYSYLIDIIKNIPVNPQTPYEHWIIGKACGYSDDAIGEFIKSKL